MLKDELRVLICAQHFCMCSCSAMVLSRWAGFSLETPCTVAVYNCNAIFVFNHHKAEVFYSALYAALLFYLSSAIRFRVVFTSLK